MFDFEKLEVYKKAKAFNNQVYHYLTNNKALDRTTRDQLRRASFSVMLNIAEGSGRFSKADRCNFFVIARGSVFECVAVFDFLKDEQLMFHSVHMEFYHQAEELSKMLFAMIKNLKTERERV
jgi:four helix bundle protein